MGAGQHGVGFVGALAAARADKARGYEHLFHLVAAPLAGYLRSRGSPDPDGLANDVLVRALTQLDRFTGDESGFRAWVFSIARCRLVDERRARRRRIDAEALDERSIVLVGGDVEDDAMADLGGDWVEATLASLSADQREVLLLRVVSDLSIEETAAVIQKTPGAVKALQHRALEAIRRELSLEAVSM